jgi:hypothetical protein
MPSPPSPPCFETDTLPPNTTLLFQRPYPTSTHPHPHPHPQLAPTPAPPQVYLRYHKLALGGKKADLIARVKDHALAAAT